MKISMIGPVYPYRGGIAHYTALLAQALLQSGHDLQMISFERQYPAFLYPGESDKDPSANAIHIPARYLLDPLYPWTWQRAVREIRAAGPQLVLFHWWSTFWGPAYAALSHTLRRSTPVVFLIHNVFPHEIKPWDRGLASLALGQCLVGSGAADWLASGAVSAIRHLNPALQVASVMTLAAVLTNFVSNSAAAAIGTPIAVTMAHQLGITPEPFVLAILFGANLSYATPMAYQTNMLIMTAARYRFGDFVRVGLPLLLLMLAALSFLLVRHYGL